MICGATQNDQTNIYTFFDKMLRNFYHILDAHRIKAYWSKLSLKGGSLLNEACHLSPQGAVSVPNRIFDATENNFNISTSVAMISKRCIGLIWDCI